MTPTEKAEELITHFKMILMDEDTDCGCEILCTSIAKKSALIAVDEILKSNVVWYENSIPYKYWIDVKIEIEKL
jgi:hypothetical protein